MSCHKYAFKRAGCRSTWLKHLVPGMEYFFMVGRGAEPVESDVVKLDADDGYGALHKQHATQVYAVTHYDFDWLFRVDDDTFVVPSRLPILLFDFEQYHRNSLRPKVEMIGSDWLPDHTWGSGGGGLLFSRRVVEYQAKAGVRPGCTDGDDGWACARARPSTDT